jgi:hypothetical protein
MNMQFKLRTYLAAFLGILLTGVAMLSAQETTTNELPPPDEHMKEMEWFIGEWDVVSRMLMADGQWMEENVSSINTYVLNGHVILENFVGPLGGEPFEAWSLRKYNPVKGKWEQRWVDTSASGFADWTGSYADDQFIGHANRTLNEDGTIKASAVREVFYNITEDSFSWKFETTEDGGETWTETWTLEYTRKPM